MGRPKLEADFSQSATRDPLRAARRRGADFRAGAARLTSRWRPLPQALLIGGQRCGTTFLFHALAEHPEMRRPLSKEVGFFTHYWDRGEAWYRGNFPIARRIDSSARRLGGGPVAFEATPYYLFHPRAASRAATVVPDAKLLVLLRDPADRAYSHYWHSVQRGWEELCFADAVDAEERRLAGEAERITADPAYVSVPHRVYSYLARGRYAEQLELWRRHFPRERMLVLRSEELFAAPQQLYDRITSFLGLSPWQPDFSAARRAAGKLASPPHPAMGRAMRAQLCDYYQKYNAVLAEILDWPETWPTAGMATA